jgi:hypothetical protein
MSMPRVSLWAVFTNDTFVRTYKRQSDAVKYQKKWSNQFSSVKIYYCQLAEY